MKADIVQNGKTDTNNNGAFSTDYIGGSWDYPEGDYATRARDLAGARRLHPGLSLFPGQRPAGARGAARGDEAVGPLPRTSSSTPTTGRPALRPRGAADDRRVRRCPRRTSRPSSPSPTPSAWAPTTATRTTSSGVDTADGAVENEGDMQVAVDALPDPVPRDAAEAGGGDQPAGAGLLLGDPRGLLDAAHGAAVHDLWAGRRTCREDGDRRGVAVQDIDTGALRASLEAQHAPVLQPREAEPMNFGEPEPEPGT